MKTLLLISVLALGISPLSAQTIRRIVSSTGRTTDWVPTKEKTGNLVKFSQSTRKLGLTVKTHGLTWSDLSARGFQFVQNVDGTVPISHQLGTPGTHESGPHTVTLGKPASQWTQQECYHFGRNVTPVYGLTADQFGEGYSPTEIAGLMDTRSQAYRWTMEGMRDKAATMTPKAILIGSYETKFDGYQAFQPGGGAWNPNSAENRNALSSGAAARAGIWWFDLEVSHYVMPIFQVYPIDPDRKLMYQQAYGIQRLQKACEGWASPGQTLNAYLYLWPMLSIGNINSSFTAFEHDLTNPSGKLYQHQLANISINTILGVSLNTFVLTGPSGGMYVWETLETYSASDPNRVNTDFVGEGLPPDKWVPYNNAPAPARAAAPYMPKRPMGAFNGAITAAEMYGEMAAAGGENFRFARFKIGNGAYIEPGAGDTSILEAAAQYRGWCRISQNGSGYGIYYTNPFAPISGETITVDLGGGKTVTFDCFDNEPVVIAGTHPGGNVTLMRANAFN